LAGVGYELGLEMGDHHRDLLAPSGHCGRQNTASERIGKGFVLCGGRVVEDQVTGLNRHNSQRVGGEIHTVRQEPGRQERHTDATGIGDAGETVVKIDAARRIEVGEHLLGPDLLKGKHVRRDGVDDLRQAATLSSYSCCVAGPFP